jgi:hypothetical protein
MPDDTLLERLQSANRRLAEDNATLLRKVSELEHLVTCREVDLRRAERHLHEVMRLVDKAEKDLAYIRNKALAYSR